MKKRQTTKSSMAIRNTFIKLVQEKQLNKITVSEIAREANVSRGTFYLHFKDVYDLYNSIEDELYAKLGDIFDKYYVSQDDLDLESLTDSIVQYIYENKEVFFILINPHHSEQTLSRVRSFCYDRMTFSPDKNYVQNYERTRAVFIISGYVGVLEQWLVGGLSVSKAQISDILQIFVSQIRLHP